MKKLELLFLFAIVQLAMVQGAYAYLDANTGSMILQTILAGAAGLMVVGKMYWARLFGRSTPAEPTEPTEISALDDEPIRKQQNS